MLFFFSSLVDYWFENYFKFVLHGYLELFCDIDRCDVLNIRRWFFHRVSLFLASSVSHIVVMKISIVNINNNKKMIVNHNNNTLSTFVRAFQIETTLRPSGNLFAKCDVYVCASADKEQSSS